MIGFSLSGSSIIRDCDVTVGAAISIGKEVAEMDELGTATGSFELLQGILGAAANFGAAFGSEC